MTIPHVHSWFLSTFEARLVAPLLPFYTQAWASMSTPEELECGSLCREEARGSSGSSVKNFDRLQEQFPWLECRTDQFGVGCSVCRKAYGEGSCPASHGGLWREKGITSHSSLQPRNLQKHQDSRSHQEASDSQAKHYEWHAPSAPDFKSLLRHAQKNPVGEAGVASVGGHKKCRKMLWCLAEAHRELNRQLFRPGHGVGGQPVVFSSSIFQDARAGRLTIRFTAASSRVERRMGHFGTCLHCKDFSNDSVGLLHATMYILRVFCVRNLSPPYVDDYSKVPAPEEDVVLQQHVLASIETFVSDAASDEIRAGRMLAGQTVSMDYAPKLPNLTLVVRDRPHAVRRVLSRGWKADGLLNDVFERFVDGRGSPVRLINYSETFKAWFNTNIKNMEGNLKAVRSHPHLSDLRYAPHRFESASAPLSRVVLFFHPLLATLVQIMSDRREADEGKQVMEFMRWLSDEKCVLLALMADAAQETTDLIRMLDYQGFPCDELPSRVQGYKDRVRCLFTGPQPACLCTGFTCHMLKLLQHEYVINIPKPRGQGMECIRLGRPGGVTQALLDRCLQRLQAWVLLEEGTLDAEFPAFDVQNAFSVFTVTGSTSAAEQQSHESLIRCSSNLARLQKSFGLEDNDAAVDQLVRIRPIAVRCARDEGQSSVEAWMSAVKKVTRTWNKSDISALLPVLVRFWASGASTSAVEQAFGKSQRVTEKLVLAGHINDAMEAWFGLSETYCVCVSVCGLRV